MKSLINDIITFLNAHGIACRKALCCGLEMIAADVNGSSKFIMPLEIKAHSLKEAIETSQLHRAVLESIDNYPLIITEDRWHRNNKMMQLRLLAHLEIFSQVFARNCEVRRIEKPEAQAFLRENHSYGYAASKYHYGIFLKRNRPARDNNAPNIPAGTLVAVASFSGARKWDKDGAVIRSYEWTRYASLPNLRISGGMGKILKAFIKEIDPDDIMSYADLEWSQGSVYQTLGFVHESSKAPVAFTIDPTTWQRKALTNNQAQPGLYFCNLGSAKYRLKLTDYK